MGPPLPDLGTPQPAIAITAGTYHTCVILPAGRVRCWGFNQQGQLGVGDTETRGDGPGDMGANLPDALLPTDRTVKQLTAGEFHNCAILSDDSLKCWGGGGYGATGQGNVAAVGTNKYQLPTQGNVDLGAGRTAKQVAARGYLTCAIVDNDRVKCWGQNSNGSLGLGLQNGDNRGDDANEMGNNLPYVELGTGRTAKFIALYWAGACAILDNDQVKCWGYNPEGLLGLGDTEARGDQLSDMGDNLPVVNLGAGRKAVALEGFGNMCARLDDGSLKCWGGVNAGALGQEDNQARGDNPGEMGDALLPIRLGTGRSAVAVAAGLNHVCALLENKAVKCWGSIEVGQLGSGDNVYRGFTKYSMGDYLPYVNFGN